MDRRTRQRLMEKIWNEAVTFALILGTVMAWVHDWRDLWKVVLTALLIAEAFSIMRGDRSD